MIIALYTDFCETQVSIQKTESVTWILKVVPLPVPTILTLFTSRVSHMGVVV